MSNTGESKDEADVGGFPYRQGSSREPAASAEMIPQSFYWGVHKTGFRTGDLGAELYSMYITWELQ